ncbi:hypothetical protein J6590_103999, partial [Homalodisca vitripennis]
FGTTRPLLQVEWPGLQTKVKNSRYPVKVVKQVSHQLSCSLWHPRQTELLGLSLNCRLN